MLPGTGGMASSSGRRKRSSRSVTGRVAGFSPRTRHEPPWGCRRPHRSLSKVVLPAPFLPSSPWMPPGSRCRSRARNRRFLLEYPNERFSIATKLLSVAWPGAFFGPWAPLRYVDAPRGELPGPRWARVRTRLGGICGSDLHQVFIDGSLSVSPAAFPGRSPGFLGHEAVGEVVEVGSGVTRVRPGDRV